jgi:enoyl-CoA hydratase/carnithine racemase
VLLLSKVKLEKRQAAVNGVGTFVRLSVDRAMVILQLDDPRFFNTFSSSLCEDFCNAVEHIYVLPSVSSVVLQGSGPHFSAGGNPYAASSCIMPSAGVALSLREMYNGFLQLRLLPHPIIGAVHGTLIGGGIASSVHVDYLAADHASTFEHGVQACVSPAEACVSPVRACSSLYQRCVWLSDA